MAAFRLACHLIQFGAEAATDPEKVLREVAEAGWPGVEGLRARDADELVALAALARRFGLEVVNTGGPRQDPMAARRYDVALGNRATEVPARRRSDGGGPTPADGDSARAARSLDEPLAFCAAHRVRGFPHAHLGTMSDTVADAERLLTAAPELWLLLDTGHLLAAGGDPLAVFRSDRLRGRIAHVHLKDVHADDPASWDHRTPPFGERGRFAELGAGNAGLDAAAVPRALDEIGYDGRIAAEPDKAYPPRPPAEAAAANRRHLQTLGY